MLRGVNRTAIGGVYSLVTYYLLGIPLSCYFGFTCGMGGEGLWLGLMIASNVACPATLILLRNLNWEVESLRAVTLLSEARQGVEMSNREVV